MKKYLLLIGFSLISVKSFADDWTGKDKNLHFLAGASISSLVTVATKDEKIGFISGVAMGLAKEVYDSKNKGDVSGKDFIVTALGSAIGAKITGLYISSDGIYYEKKWSFK